MPKLRFDPPRTWGSSIFLIQRNFHTADAKRLCKKGRFKPEAADAFERCAIEHVFTYFDFGSGVIGARDKTEGGHRCFYIPSLGTNKQAYHQVHNAAYICTIEMSDLRQTLEDALVDSCAQVNINQVLKALQ